MSRSDNANDKCEDLNPPLKRNNSGLYTGSSRISYESDATSCGQSTSGSYDLTLSWFGKK